MRFFGLCYILLSFIQHGYFFKIEIYKCLTSNGLSGFCREKLDCVGATQSLETRGCPSGLICCPKKGVSEKKCYEYAKAVYGKRDAAVNLMATFKEPSKNDECGIVVVPLIVGGEKARLKEFPHMVGIGFGTTPYTAQWHCGGSLISEFYVLSAAHCAVNSNAGRPSFAKLGAVNVKSDHGKNVQLFEIEKIIIHPRYVHYSKLNDIAIFKLSKKVRFNPFVRPICLDYTGKIKEKKAIATGWGKTLEEHELGNEDLMKVQLDLLERNDCKRVFHSMYRSKEVEDSKICAGVMVGGKDTCQGDSGGPMQTIRKKPYCMYNLIGITSFGRSCGYAWAPALYTRVFTFIPWIENIVWPDEN